jgi:hypothetical protein
LVPFITTAAYQATGSLGYTLIYPIAVPAVCFVLSLFLMPRRQDENLGAAGSKGVIGDLQDKPGAGPKQRRISSSHLAAMPPIATKIASR